MDATCYLSVSWDVIPYLNVSMDATNYLHVTHYPGVSMDLTYNFCTRIFVAKSKNCPTIYHAVLRERKGIAPIHS
jgi:hypothetical protein